jgi:hypothetical protein
VNAADAREQLEAVIWRERGGDPRRPARDVDRILAAADAYAQATAEAAYADAVARVGHAQSRDPGEPPRVVAGDIVRELTTGRPA